MEEDYEEDSDNDGEDEEVEDDEEEEEDYDDSRKSKKRNELIAKPRGCIVKEGTIHNGYTILMTKVDVSFGAWGMYNFYRMQVRPIHLF